jgi:hypothetical protein
MPCKRVTESGLPAQTNQQEISARNVIMRISRIQGIKVCSDMTDKKVIQGIVDIVEIHLDHPRHGIPRGYLGA